MNSWKVIFAVALIFGSGVLTGSMIFRKRPAPPQTALSTEPVVTNQTNPPAPWQLQRIEFFKRMEKNLTLSPEQHERISKIMRESQERTKPVWEQIEPQMREELKRVRNEIRAELNPEQRKKFESMLKPKNPRKTEDASAEEKAEKRKRAPRFETNRMEINRLDTNRFETNRVEKTN